jgi:serine protease AprX
MDPFNTRTYRISLLPWHDAYQTLDDLRNLDADLTRDGNMTAAILSPEDVINAAQLTGVLWIEPLQIKTLHNDIGGGNIMNGSTAWSAGYDGTDVYVAALDSGFDTGNPVSIHADFGGLSRIYNISSYPVYPYDWGCGATLNPWADDGPADVDSGHGTHVIGSIAGDGSQSPTGFDFKGMAYGSNINFQAAEQYVDWPESPCPGLDDYYLMLPPFLNVPLEEAYTWATRIHNNSWGWEAAGQYDSDAADYDTFIYQNPNFFVTVSAGNSGEDTNSGGDGYVDLDSINSPATAKNVLTIGATDNVRSTGGYTGWTWGASWPSYYSTAPTSTDLISDNSQHMAAFSSVGPTDDGRIKPDLVAPGTDIISTLTSQISPTNPGWGPYDNYYMYMGGTSMASPLAAGAAALVRDYYMTTESQVDPSAALIKATLINTAVDINGYGNANFEAGQPIPNMHEGWGRIDVGAAVDNTHRIFYDSPQPLNTGEIYSIPLNISPIPVPLKITLVWTDPPAAASATPTLVNDLDLSLIDPGGGTYFGNNFAGGWSQLGGAPDLVNNVENIYINIPTPGTYTLTVTGANINIGPQDFALVIQANVAPQQPVKVYLPLLIKSGSRTASAPTAFDPIINGGFEGGHDNGWWEHDKRYFDFIIDNTSGYYHSGGASAWMGGISSHDHYQFLSQPMVIPVGRSYLHYWYSINSNEPSCASPYNDVVYIRVDNYIVDTIPLCIASNVGWTEGVLDLSAFAGGAIKTIRFEIYTTSGNNSNFFIDDVSLEATARISEESIQTPSEAEGELLNPTRD